MTQPSPLYRLIEAQLRRPLAEVVAELRATQSWPEIAHAITVETGIELHSETLRLWFKDRITVEVKVS